MNNSEENQKDKKLFQLMDIINNDNDNNLNLKLNIPDYSMSSNSKEAPETLDEEDESKQSLNPEHNDLLDMNDSGIIQIPNKYVNEQSQSISNNLNSSENEMSTPLSSKENA